MTAHTARSATILGVAVLALLAVAPSPPATATECTPVRNTLSNGDPQTTDGALTVTVDGLGSFGEPVRGDAIFNPTGPIGAAGTVSSSNVYLESADALLEDCHRGHKAQELSRSADSLVTRASIGPLELRLDQRLAPIAGGRSTLTQTYTFTNEDDASLPLLLVRHVDADLYFDDEFMDGGAASADGALLSEFDWGDDSAAPRTFFGIAGALDGDATPGRWTIQPFDYRDELRSANGIPADDDREVHGDGNGDRVVDAPYDVTLSQQWSRSLAPGASATFVTETLFGLPNRPPSAAADSLATSEDAAGTVDVLANDGDPDGDALSLVGTTGGAHGTVTCLGGLCTYVPGPDFNGADSFTYTVADGRGLSATGTVAVTVAPVNDAPVAAPDGFATDEDTVLEVDAPGLLANDTDVDTASVSAIEVTDPAGGSVEVSPDGSFTYTPDPDANGEDSFTYRVDDGELDSAATVTIDVGAVNDAPVASDDAYAVDEDGALTVAAAGVLANDDDTEADDLTATLVTGTANGTLALEDDGSFTYAPAANFNGTDSFTYHADDGAGDSNLAVVTITVNPVGEPRQTLTVIRVGNARITSSPAGIDCGETCTAEFELGTVVTLTATPDPGWSFAGWAGACEGGESCVVTVDAGKAVTARFALPPPTPGQSVNVTPVAGDVLVRVAGTTQFVPLPEPSLIPLGSQIDATRGRVQVTAARAGGITDVAVFSDGAFELSQPTAAAIAELRLLLGDFGVCSLPSFAAADKNRRPVRRLWGSGKGKYRTRGRFSSATVRGTVWKTEDRCDGTLTQVQEGSVTVRDFGRQKNIVVGAGRSYLAEPLPRGVRSLGCTIIGTSRADVLRGTKRRDVICGLGGNDVIRGVGGNDRIYGGAGADRLSGGRGDDLLDGGAGNDWMNGGPGADVIRGGRGVDFLVVGRGADRVQGGLGADRCRTDAVRPCP
ncbi:MAG TPA: tandem-95 repeat protein [Gaiellaceae bacterium]|nr:tandem-95 repeat protein [Gaiellaceae bacterium]